MEARGILRESKFLESETLRSEISLWMELLVISLDNWKDDQTLFARQVTSPEEPLFLA